MAIESEILSQSFELMTLLNLTYWKKNISSVYPVRRTVKRQMS